jgi:hypothetical protein
MLETIGSPETSVNNYPSVRRNIREEQRCDRNSETLGTINANFCTQLDQIKQQNIGNKPIFKITSRITIKPKGGECEEM